MFTSKLIRPILIAVLLICSVYAPAQQVPTGGPPQEIRIQVDSFVAALNSGSAEAWERMAEEHFTADHLKRQSALEQRSLFETIQRDFGKVSLEGVEGPDQPLRLHIQGSTGATGIIELTLSDVPPRKIDKVGLRIGGAGGVTQTKVEAPLINGSMSEQQIATVLNPYLSTLVAKEVFSGDVLIAKDGKPVYAGSAGFANRADKLPNSASTRFNIGSINKIFTKLAIQQLVSQGKLSLTDTIGQLLPDYPQAASRDATVDQLLHHTGGIADVFGDDFARASKERFRSNRDYYKLVTGLVPMFSPGARTQYCNGCFVVLGAIIERISAMTYEEYVQQHIFAPAGMHSTGYLQSDGLEPNVALGYTRDGTTAPFRSNLLLNGASGCAAGGGYSTTADLLRYAEAVKHGLIPDADSSNDLNVGGGAPGINAIIQQRGQWTVIVLANMDPPAAETLATTLMRSISHD